MSEAEFKENYIIKKFVNMSWIELVEVPVTVIRGLLIRGVLKDS